MSENHLDNIELRSEEVQEILTKVPHWMIRWGNVMFLALTLLLFIMSYVIRYPDIILSEAVLTTKIPPQKEYAKITAKISAILVEDNQEVIKGQPLAILENTANYKDVYYLKSIIDTITLNNRYFHFPIDDLGILFLGDAESQFALFENSYLQYKLNQDLEPFSNEALANQHSISELNRQLKNLVTQKEINKTELAIKEKGVKRNKILFEKGIISSQDFENNQVEYAQAKRNYQNFESSISQIRGAISNARKTSKGTEISRVKEEMALLKNVIQSFNQLKKAVKDWEYTYVLKSDISGNVSFLNVWNINQTVNQGDLVFSIIPNENSSFVAKLKTPMKNSGKIKVNQVVNIKLENYPDTEFGVLVGRVEKISLIPDKEGFYNIDVSLPKKLITSYNEDIDFKQEMVGVAEIITEDLRLIERFFYQLKDIVKR